MSILKVMPILFMISFSSLFLFSCGNINKSSVRNLPLNQEISAGALLSTEDQEEALSICLGLRSKKTVFPVDYRQHAFSFQTTGSDCLNNPLIAKTFTGTLNYINALTAMYYDTTYTGLFHSSIETNSHGLFRRICDDIFDGNEINDTITSQFEKIQYNFANPASTKELKIIEVTTADRVTDASSPFFGKYYISKIDTYKIVTKSDGQLPYGAVKEIQNIKVCQDSSESVSSTNVQLLLKSEVP
jgi:hypothetical protein